MNLGGFSVAQFAEGQRRFAELMRASSWSVKDFAPAEPADTPPVQPGD